MATISDGDALRIIDAVTTAIRAIRLHHTSLTGMDLAQRCGISLSVVSRIETGVRNHKRPALLYLIKMCCELGIRPSEIFRLAEDYVFGPGYRWPIQLDEHVRTAIALRDQRRMTDTDDTIPARCVSVTVPIAIWSAFELHLTSTGWLLDELPDKLPRASHYVVCSAKPRQPASIKPLSTTELHILELVAAGLTNSQIGGRLHRTEGTIKIRLKHILDKLAAVNRAHAVHVAHITGLFATQSTGHAFAKDPEAARRPARRHRASV